MSRALDLLESLNESMRGFDYVDRIVVSLFMFVTTLLLIFTLSQELGPAEKAEIAPAIEVFSHLPIFFLLWPLILGVLSGSVRFAIEQWQKRGDSA